ncbi:MAG: peptidoglycan DD-metalloendopeptidase family protein [Betaproteobacteria bacterium]
MVARKLAILAQSASPAVRRAARALSPGQWLGAAILALSGVAAFGLAPGTTLETVPTTRVVRALPVPPLRPVAGADAGYWRDERVQRGDTVGSVLARLGVDDPDAMAFLRTDPAARPLYQLRPGRPLVVETGDDGRLLRLRFVTGGGDLLSIARDGERLAATTVAAPADIRLKVAAGEIRSSLFGAADAIGLPDAVTIQLADVFSGDIDFYKDLQRGDRFSVVYEVRYVDGEAVGAGRIVAAEFANRGKTFRAFLWRDIDGTASYYAEDGAALRKAFLRSPMEFSRMTSGFSNARFHPILQTWRAHRGVDYAAPTGTPVRATGNGKVTFAGVQGGYGNVVVLQHSGAYSTVYAHLSRFAAQAKPGTRVAQGDVIGYVGQTGWATGPHLHYEFRVANVQRNPVTVALPGGEPLPATRRPAFVAGIAPAVAQLEIARALPGAVDVAAE